MRFLKIVLLVLLNLFLMHCGSPQNKTSSLPPHHTEHGFRNTNPAYVPPGWWDLNSFIISKIWQSTFAPRTFVLPVQEYHPSDLQNPLATPSVTWVGHSTLLVQLENVNVLTDPQWSDRASPVSFAGPKRLSPPGIRFEDLPPIHLVLISHNHYDHLNLQTIERLAAAHDPLFLVPLGLKEWFHDHHLSHVKELDWWEQYPFQSITVVCLPAQHFSKRTLWDRNETLWSSWAVIGKDKRFFFSGDTGYYPVFKKIGKHFGPFDLAAITIGAYLPREVMNMTHLTPEEALQVFMDLQARRMVGIHWGTFDLTEEPLGEPPKRLYAEAKHRGLNPENIWALNPGETRQW